MRETAKANNRRYSDYLFRRIIKGKGIDIGYGDDMLGSVGPFKDAITCEGFDVKDGDAQIIHTYKQNEGYDFVYSSNCLEHLQDPKIALNNWLKLVKNNGYLIFTVPDEDLYEQGSFPSRFNSDHKWTFTINKKTSWSPKSINIIDFLKDVECKILRIQLVDDQYDYSKKGVDQTLNNAEAFIEIVLQKENSNA